VRGISDLLSTLALVLPPWAYPIVLAAVAAIAVPAWANSIRVKQVRNRVRFYVRAGPGPGDRYLTQAFQLAAGRPRRLVALADEAIRFKLPPVWGRALAELEATGRCKKDLAHLRAKVQPEAPRPVHPVEEAARVRTMLEAGAWERARERLGPALEAFPLDEDLLALAEQLAELLPSAASVHEPVDEGGEQVEHQGAHHRGGHQGPEQRQVEPKQEGLEGAGGVVGHGRREEPHPHQE